MLKSLKSKDENFVNGVQASGEDSGEDVGEGGGQDGCEFNCVADGEDRG